MKRLIAVVALIVATAPAAGAQESGPVSAADLLADPEAYTGEVVVVGELIGDFGFRSDQSMWTQLNDDSYVFDPVLDGGQLTGGNVGIAVRIPSSLAATFGDPGGYRVRGPVVEITGTWKYHDPDRGGESYIDVLDLVVVEPGHDLAEHPNYWVLAAGVVFVGAALFLRRPVSRRRKR